MSEQDPKKPVVDWERVEADYRAGILSLREIAGIHGITEGAVRKRAKRDEWARDLAAKVQAKAAELVRKELVRSEVRSSEGAYSEKEIVDANSAVVAGIQISQRKDIRRFRDIALSLLSELEVETGSIDLFVELGLFLRNEDEKGQDKRNDVYQKVISSASRIDGVKKLAETLKILVTLEREVYGIAAASDKTDAVDNLAVALEAARKRRRDANA